MNYRLTILPQAKEDVRRNAEWWAQHHSVIESGWQENGVLHVSWRNNEARLKTGELTMEKTASNLVDEIKKLSRQDQGAIIAEILETLDDDGEEFDDEELLRELQRREADGLNGSVSWSVLRDMP